LCYVDAGAFVAEEHVIIHADAWAIDLVAAITAIIVTIAMSGNWNA
jgi:hypothetical protein